MESTAAAGMAIAMYMGALLWSPMIGCMAIAIHARSKPLRLVSRIFATLMLLVVSLMAFIAFSPT